MGSCIICGRDADGDVCASHEQDVFFEFQGTEPGELTPGRYYRGEVDGVAEFGVFVDIGERVTGLLHESELPKRLEAYDWEPGDTLYVLVDNIRDNGDVDLAWSIRQSEAEFRGALVDDPAAPPTAIEEEPDATPSETEPEGDAGPTPGGAEAPTAAREAEAGGTAAGAVEAVERPPEIPRVGAAELDGRDGERVRVEGRVANIRQTGGPTVFTVRDETGSVDCAAFEAPGVRAYPDVDVDDVVRIEGDVERHEGAIQLETSALSVLAGGDRDAVEDRLAAALEDRARPEGVELLAEYPPVAGASEAIGEAASAIRRAVMDARPVVVRHAASADGYLAGAALERAILGLIREEHEERDAVYHYVDRRPLEGTIYDLDDATRDVTDLLDGRDRHGEKVPLLVFCGVGATAESADGLGLLAQYDAQRVIVDVGPADDEVLAAATVVVVPICGDGRGGEREAGAGGAGSPVTATALAAAVAATVNPDVRDDLRPLPATSFWRDAPSVYVDLAAEAGVDDEIATRLREAVALQAFYQAYEDKRELIDDILFDDHDLAVHASDQFRSRLADELETARAHVEVRTVGDRAVAVLDTHAFTHRFDFPPTDLLLDRLYPAVEADALIGVDEDTLRVTADPPIDVRRVASRVREVVADAGVEARGGRDGTLVFLAGEREVVLDAAVGAVAKLL